MKIIPRNRLKHIIKKLLQEYHNQYLQNTQTYDGIRDCKYKTDGWSISNSLSAGLGYIYGPNILMSLIYFKHDEINDKKLVDRLVKQINDESITT